MKLLLETKANLQATDNGGVTALHQAVSEGHTEVVELLLGANSDPNAVSAVGAALSWHCSWPSVWC